MEDQKRVLIADFDKMGRFGTKLACEGLENVEVMTAATKEEALAVINGEHVPDLVIVDPMKELHVGSCGGFVDVKEGPFAVMREAVARNIQVMIITGSTEMVEHHLVVIGMASDYNHMLKKAAGYEATQDAVVKALAS
jgi:CheY-like chemotaxis protein